MVASFSNPHATTICYKHSGNARAKCPPRWLFFTPMGHDFVFRIANCDNETAHFPARRGLIHPPCKPPPSPRVDRARPSPFSGDPRGCERPLRVGRPLLI